MASIDLSVVFSGDSSPTLGARVKWAEEFILGGSSDLFSSDVVRYTFSSTLIGSSSLVATPTVSLGIQSPIRYQPASRIVSVSKLVLDQIDLFLVDSKTRAQDVVVSDLNLKVFFNGSQVQWPLVSGLNVQDSQVTAGQAYWTEFLAGFYTLRFFPNVIGSWRVLLTYPTYDQAVSLSYDVIQPSSASISSGIHTSFVRR
jgi:hypothetical protein